MRKVLNKASSALTGPSREGGVTNGGVCSSRGCLILGVTPSSRLGPVSALLALFLLFSQVANAQNLRPTSFENRDICEDSKGVWRQFGNGCADECESKFDKYSICTQALVYSCECGKGRCWNGDSCVTLVNYKKVFDVQKAKEQKILDAAKEKRKDAAQANLEAVMLRLVPPPPPDPNAKPAPVAATNPAPTPTPTPTPTASQVDASPTSPITQIAVPVATPAPPTEIEIPQFLLKKQAQQQNKNQDSKSDPAITIPGLPVVPLPN